MHLLHPFSYRNVLSAQCTAYVKCILLFCIYVCEIVFMFHFLVLFSFSSFILYFCFRWFLCFPLRAYIIVCQMLICKCIYRAHDFNKTDKQKCEMYREHILCIGASHFPIPTDHFNSFQWIIDAVFYAFMYWYENIVSIFFDHNQCVAFTHIHLHIHLHKHRLIEWEFLSFSHWSRGKERKNVPTVSITDAQPITLSISHKKCH